MSTPYHTHDSECCTFVGQSIPGQPEVDYYYCASNNTVLARYSSEPSDYASGRCFITSHPDIARAAMHALKKGVVSLATLTMKVDSDHTSWGTLPQQPGE